MKAWQGLGWLETSEDYGCSGNTVPWGPWGYMAVSVNKGSQYKPQYTLIFIVGTREKGFGILCKRPRPNPAHFSSLGIKYDTAP